MPARDKILPLPRLLDQVRAWQAAGDRVVFANGCFDLLHVGHVRYLHAAAALGDTRQPGDALSAGGRPLPGSEARPQPDQREGGPSKQWPRHRLVVAVNSDASTRRLKGPGRPLASEQARAELVAAVRGVSAVVVFDEPTVEPLLRALRPAIHAKGTDYTAATVPEAAVAAELGIAVRIVGDPKRHSSAELLRRLCSADH